MAQTWSYDRLCMSGEAQPTLKDTGINPSGRVLAKITGPASSVQAGMSISGLTTDLPSYCYGGRIVGVGASNSAAYDYRIVPSSTYTTSALTIEAIRRSTGTLLSSSVVLTSENLYVEFIGY